MRTGLLVLILAATLHPSMPVDWAEFDRQLSWVHWWEVNRDTYLEKAITKAGPAAPAKGEIRDRAIKALTDASKSKSSKVRAEAALAMARMGEGKERLVEMTTDTEQRVRCRAWVGLGLLAETEILLAAKDLEAPEMIAVVSGLGLKDPPGDAAMARIRELARKSPPGEVQRMCLWAIRVNGSKDDRRVVQEILRETPNPTVAIEAMMALGAIGDERDVAGLAEIVDAGPAALALPVFVKVRAASLREDIFTKGLSAPGIFDMRGAAALALAEIGAKLSSPTSGGAAGNGGVNQDVIRAMNVLSRNAFKNREKISLGGNNVYMAPTNVYPGMAVMALAQLDPGSVTNLLQGRKPTIYGTDPDGLRVLPARGYAAMALGAHIASGAAAPPLMGSDLPGGTRGQSLDREGYLASQARNSSEFLYVRAACTLALGMSGDELNRNAVANVARQLKTEDGELMWGYTTLALGLLGDPRTLEMAQVYLGKGVKEIEATKILASEFNHDIEFVVTTPVKLSGMQPTLGKRAAVLGLAALRDPRAASILMSQWGKDQYVSIDAARALGWCGVYEPADAFIALMREDKQSNLAALAAQSLGEMFDKDCPSRLGRLVTGNCPAQPMNMPKDEWLAPEGVARIQAEFHGLGNRFLYWRLLPGNLDWN